MWGQSIVHTPLATSEHFCIIPCSIPPLSLSQLNGLVCSLRFFNAFINKGGVSYQLIFFLPNEKRAFLKKVLHVSLVYTNAKSSRGKVSFKKYLGKLFKINICYSKKLGEGSAALPQLQIKCYGKNLAFLHCLRELYVHFPFSVLREGKKKGQQDFLKTIIFKYKTKSFFLRFVKSLSGFS